MSLTAGQLQLPDRDTVHYSTRVENWHKVVSLYQMVSRPIPLWMYSGVYEGDQFRLGFCLTPGMGKDKI